MYTKTLQKVKKMKINRWIENIKRVRKPRLTKKPLYRCDFAERLINFEDDFFENFIKTLTQEDFITYPSYDDYLKLQARIGDLFNLEFDNVYMTTGSGSCIKDLIQVTCTRDSEIICSSPCFPMYFVFGETFGAKFIKATPSKIGNFNSDDYTAKTTENTRLVIVTNPNSPYGDLRSKSDIEDLCKYYESEGVVVLIDEAYADFSNTTSTDLIKKYKNVVVSRTFSKAWGAAGTRVGYLLGDKNLIKTISNVQLTYPITGPSLKFINYLLDNHDVIKEYVDKSNDSKNILLERLNEANFDTFPSNTNSVHFHDKNDNSRPVLILEKYNVAFRSGLTIENNQRKNWIRLSIGPGIEETDFIKEIIDKDKK